MRHRHAIACLLLVLAAPQLGGCIAALVGGVAVGASAAPVVDRSVETSASSMNRASAAILRRLFSSA